MRPALTDERRDQPPTEPPSDDAAAADPTAGEGRATDRPPASEPEAPDARAAEPEPDAASAAPPAPEAPGPEPAAPPSQTPAAGGGGAGDAGGDDSSGPPPGGGGAGSGGTGAAPGERPGLREQLARVRAAITVLVQAHVTLLRAELAVIGEQIQQIAAMAGGIVVLALYAATLLAIGGTLFLGEWLFGSIGWGVVHGTLLAIGIIVSLALLIIEAPRTLLTRPLAWGVVAGVLVAVVLGLNVPRNLSVWVGEWVTANLVPTLDPTYAPAVVAMVVFAVVLGLVGLVVGARSEGGMGAISGLLVGALAGALIGIWFGGFTYSWQGAAAIGVTLGLVTWIALMGYRASKANLDPQARFEKLWPRQTYETALETRAWLEEEWTKRLRRPGSR